MASGTATTTRTADAIHPVNTWLPQLLQRSDSMFPTGAYAHSFGLEGAVQDGLVTDTASLDEFLTHQIVPALRQLELPCARHVFDAARASASSGQAVDIAAS